MVANEQQGSLSSLVWLQREERPSFLRVEAVATLVHVPTLLISVLLPDCVGGCLYTGVHVQLVATRP